MDELMHTGQCGCMSQGGSVPSVPIFLIGFMGAGKTTLGRALASSECCPATGAWVYIDLDEIIEQREGMAVRAIFHQKGEAYFRCLESEMLRETARQGNVIVGCGGGTPCHSGNMEWMNANGLTVLLEASRQVLLRRLLQAQQQRPLLAGLSAAEIGEFIDAKMKEREPFYSLARLRFPSDHLESEKEIAESCLKFHDMISSVY